MEYIVVFDLSTQPRPWHVLISTAVLSLLSDGGVVALITSVLRRRHQPEHNGEEIPALLLFLGLALVGLLIPATITYQHTSLWNAVRQGEGTVVEGYVQSYTPKLVHDHEADESFRVGERTFSYSGYEMIGFHHTKVRGGPIEEGVYVRVTYVGDTIVRLEVRE